MACGHFGSRQQTLSLPAPPSLCLLRLRYDWVHFQSSTSSGEQSVELDFGACRYPRYLQGLVRQEKDQVANGHRVDGS